MNGENDLIYGDTSLTPDGTYFQLHSSCAGRPIANSAQAVDRLADQGKCNEVTFNPKLPVSASDPAHATLVVQFQVTCGGQDSPTCRQLAAARSATTAHPVVLRFSKSIELQGSVQAPASPELPVSVAAGDATNPAVGSAAPENASPSGNSGGSLSPPEGSLPAEASQAAPESTG